ncbi:hypothetical protein SLE2022_405920 [Rubroshorea leprosula]
MAGRSAAKLAEVRDAIGAGGDVGLVVADADDAASLAALCARTSAIVSTVGPYQLYGSGLVAACAASGTAYLDLCGEPGWMRAMIDAHERQAKASGARIVFSCGFDSIPFDLGVQFLQETAAARFGAPAPRVKGRVRSMKGGFSGGTAASLKATLAAAKADPSLFKLLADPFALTPGRRGPDQPAGCCRSTIPTSMHGWHRSSWRRSTPRTSIAPTSCSASPGRHRLRRDDGGGARRHRPAAAEAIAKINPLGGDKGPKPGEGPSKEEREAGSYDVLFVGVMDDGRRCEVSVSGDRDPGYGSTSKMIAESALCLLEDVRGEGGIWTPGALMGATLRARLAANAGLAFTAT